MNKILFVMNSLGGGGAERVSSILVNWLSQRGYQIRIVALSTGKSRYELRDEIETREAKAVSWGKAGQVCFLHKEIKEWDPDLIICLSLSGAYSLLLSGMLKRYPVILSQRNDPESDATGIVRKYLRNVAYKKARTVVFQTEAAKQYFSGDIQAKSVIIYNPIMKGLPKWNSSCHKKRIINFCRLERQKNLPLLIDAFDEVNKRYPDYELWIYGDGKDRDHIIEYASMKNSAERIHINPFTDDIHKIISESAIFVSSSDYEGISNSMLESLAIGIPVVCTDCPCGGARQFIRDGENGFLCRPGNVYDMISKILYVIEHRDQILTIAEKAMEIRETLREDKILQQWLHIIKKIQDNN